MIIDEEVVEAPKEPTPTPKPNGRIGTIEAELAKVRQELDEVRWCFAEFMHNMRLAAAQQMLQQPEIKARLEQMLMEQMSPGA